jgi:hypothetical protein
LVQHEESVNKWHGLNKISTDNDIQVEALKIPIENSVFERKSKKKGLKK